MTFFEYLSENWIDVLNHAILHVDVTLIAVGLAIVLGVGIGILTYRSELAGSLATSVTGAFLTVPSVALFGVLIAPLGLGVPPQLVAMTLYALLPITRNTIVGLRGVDDAVIESGRGMGLGRARMLWQIRLPLAWPVIFSGVRISTQLVIGIGALGAFVKGWGLGNEIVSGLGRWGGVNATNQVLAGTLGIVVLALLFDLAYILVGRLTTSKGLRV